jgi:hypothetical protein
MTMPEPSDAAMLPEHAANPFIAPLGPIRNYWANLDLFDRRPTFSEAERALPPHLRRYCILRLFEFNVSLDRQAQLAERIGMVIRKGYEGRDPAKGMHHAAILDSADRLEAGTVASSSKRRVESTAVGFALLGHPGMGKSRSVSIVLDAFQRTLVPALPYSVVQVPHLMVQCQSMPTRKGMCIAILIELGNRVGIDYVKLLDAERKTADTLVLHVQNKLIVHAVGVLVIDEIQNMDQSREGSAVVMNFLVMLVNTAGIPVLLVGTMGATNVVQRDFRGARRAAGLGSLIWERLPPGEEWDAFFAALMGYQWTRERTEPTDALNRAFYAECQGLLSVAVTLMVLVQFRATQLGEVRDEPELISEGLVRQVAADEFKIIRPMLNALREGCGDAPIRYPDLEEFSRHVDNVVALAAGVLPRDVRRPADGREPARIGPEDPSALLRSALGKRGIGMDVIDRIVTEVVAKVPSGDAFEMVSMAQTLLQGVEGDPKVARRRETARRRKAGAEAGPIPADPFDLREIIEIARKARTGKEPITSHRALADAGMVATVAAIVSR